MSDWVQHSGFEAAQRDYDRQLPPENKACAECALRESYICEGEEFYEVAADVYCTDCMDSCREIVGMDQSNGGGSQNA